MYLPASYLFHSIPPHLFPNWDLSPCMAELGVWPSCEQSPNYMQYLINCQAGPGYSSVFNSLCIIILKGKITSNNKE